MQNYVSNWWRWRLSPARRLAGTTRQTRQSQAAVLRLPRRGREVKRNRRKKLVRIGVSQPVLAAPNDEWSLDFVYDALANGRSVRVLSIVDNFTRECLALEVDTSFASQRVTRILDGVIARRGAPKALRMDNGPELTSRHFLAWCLERRIATNYIQPGRPMQNGHIESFNGACATNV